MFADFLYKDLVHSAPYSYTSCVGLSFLSNQMHMKLITWRYYEALLSHFNKSFDTFKNCISYNEQSFFPHIYITSTTSQIIDYEYLFGI